MSTSLPQAARSVRSSRSTTLTTTAVVLAGIAPLGNAAGFLEDSKASLETRNFYMNRDFRDGPGQSKREEWAQGFILNLQSGYTQGTVGFGLDAMGMLGVKLDSGRGRSGTGLLPKDSDGRAPDTYSKLGLTAKVKVSQSELKVGTLIPKLPSVQPNNGRIFPQIFEGALLTSKEIKDLGFTAGRLEKTKIRDSSDSEDLALNDKNGRFAGVSADHFDLGGLDYKLTDQLTASYHYSNLQDVYRQHFVGLLHSWPIGPGELTSDLRFAHSTDSGSAKAGGIDNKSLNGMFTYSLGNHAFGAAWQRMNGDDAFPYLEGSNPYLVNFVQVNDFAGPKERSWQLRYDYDFVGLGIPGLTFMTRYVKGDNVELAGQRGEGREWERNTELQYVFQSGALKNLGIRWRNATFRSNFTRDIDENRLIVSYTLPIW
ncbi:TPA: OprD family porin [Pseudomonas aeruginosa]|uniref:OprD family porin n=1 Tax=Pseudomonas aeruginosa TaxID=287 RepID=UPI001ADF4D2C|nr:OprD family porin [Pseudomonas aeruginosa]MDI3955825.1 OprD family porin [Pseudomonas aeruginosa]MDV7960088.1 OprD family porin [Pseudomonas aeruginosa]HBP1721734.1 OprD family porin [Pseudomonas aeruginosa]HCE0302995.1 OprD family porin [Pseudomonas aeruginosa]HCE3808506.1 OprD family porin [Pseudomonas aeruginosa]